jgi:precorrin-3B methylase
MTQAARCARWTEADVLCGYTVYVELVAPAVPGKEVY